MKNGLIIDAIGTKRHYLNNKLHREDGPAVEWPGNMNVYYLDSHPFTEQGYWEEIKKRKSLKSIIENYLIFNGVMRIEMVIKINNF